MADAGAHVYDYFRQRYGPIVAAGIVGNTTQESSNNPNAAGGGLIQGQGGRTSSGTLEQQLHGIDAELRGPERHTLQALKGARTPQQAALIFSKMFERPGIPMNEKRQQYALEALHRYGGRDVAHATAAGAIAKELAPHLEPQGQSAAQSTDLAAALSAILHPQTAQPAVTAPRRPASAGGEASIPGAPKVPQAAQEAPQSEPASLVSLLAKLSADASPLPTAQEGGTGEAALGTHAPAVGTAASGLTSRKGIVSFNGHEVAAWIAPILHYVQAHGVTPEITSGYRSKAEQERIYNSGVRPAAVPGTSNHEGDAFPRGAVDIGNAAAVAKVLANSPYKGLLVYAGAKDPVHFSHPHGGGY